MGGPGPVAEPPEMGFKPPGEQHVVVDEQQKGRLHRIEWVGSFGIIASASGNKADTWAGSEWRKDLSREWMMFNKLAWLALFFLSGIAAAEEVAPIRIVATPNPSVLPLLLAMANEPDLPVELVPVRSGAEAAKALASGGEGLISMTWVAASESIRAVAPDLRTVSVDYRRGFFALSPSDLHVSRLADLGGRNILVSGPAGGGRNGGPDILFRALMRREGYDPSVYSEQTVRLSTSALRSSRVTR